MDLNSLRNFKDFLLLYNQISETCFLRCAGSTITRELSSNETDCVNNCTKKYVNANHRIMGVYVEVQSTLVNRRIQEYNIAAESSAAQAAAVENATKETTGSENVPAESTVPAQSAEQ